MRFHFGAPPVPEDFHPHQEGWIALREPKMLLFQLLAVPVALAAALVLGWLWGVLAPPSLSSSQIGFAVRKDSPLLPIFGVLLTIAAIGLAIIVVHEFLHAFSAPGFGLTPDTVVGLWTSRVLFYAAHTGPMSRNHYLVVFLMPFLVLSCLPLVVCAAVRFSHPLLMVVSVVNGCFACGDLMGSAMILWQVPSDAVVRNHGWQTWWKMPESTTPQP